MLHPSFNCTYRFAWDAVLSVFVPVPKWARSHGKRSALVAAIGLATLGAGPVQAACTSMPSNSTVISNGILVPQSGDTVTCAGQQFRTSVKNSTAQNVTVNVATGNNDYLTTPLSPAIDLGPGTRSIMAA